MHIPLLFITLLLFIGCSTRYPCECECQKPSLYTPNDESITLEVPSEEALTREDTPAYYNKQVSSLRQKAKPYWGDDAKVATKYEYVKYEKDYKARSIINFESGTVRVETTVTDNPTQILKEVIASTLLNTQNPENIDLFSTRHTIQVGEPFLYERVKDQDGEPIRWQWRAERYAEYLIETALHKDSIKTTAGTKKRHYVTFKMKQEESSKESNLNYSSIVNKNAKRFGISSALIFALIETESHFNPFAASGIPAYGLMQVVPHSAGRDAWKFLTKRPGQPTKNYLFNASNNIEMGSAYMHILLSRYLSKIDNPATREYCAIAAYNTGSGNVLRSFHKNREKAFNKINSMSPKEVFNHMHAKLPYKETRDYILKVTKAKKRYI